MPNFTALDMSLPEVATLVSAMVQARDAVERRSWAHPQDLVSRSPVLETIDGGLKTEKPNSSKIRAALGSLRKIGDRVYGTVVPRGAYRGSFVHRFNCTVASTASMRSPPAAMA